MCARMRLHTGIRSKTCLAALLPVMHTLFVILRRMLTQIASLKDIILVPFGIAAASTLCRAGANVIVAGTSIFGSPDPAATIAALRTEVNKAMLA